MADEVGGGGFEDAGGGEVSSLRVVPLHPEPWLAPQWLPTGEAVVSEFMRVHGEQFYWVDVAGEFYEWTGQVWARDERRRVNRLMAELCRLIGSHKKKSVQSKLESAGFIAGCAHRVRDEVAGPIEVFDRSEVLNMPGGSVRMDRTDGWSLLPARREDYCSKMATVTAAGDELPLLWLAFLARITDGRQELIDYLQRLAGYCCSPYCSEQAFFFFYGTGGNGKGAFLRTLRNILGDYAQNASLELFVSTKYESHPEELASLRGARLVLTSETEANRSWSEAKIKALTGGDAVRARFMRQNSFEYSPQFKIIVSGNHKPNLGTVDAAMRRRLHVVPFTVEIPLAEQDKKFEDRLRAEYPAILAWMLDGFVEWRRVGLAPPACVLGATEDYFDNQDGVAQWLETRCDRNDPMAFSSSTELYVSWKAFCDTRGERPGSCKSFVDRLEGKGLARHRTGTARGFIGIQVEAANITLQ